MPRGSQGEINNGIRTQKSPPSQDRQDLRADFWQYWELYEPFLSNLASSWIKDSVEAREALSAAMMKAWEGSSSGLEHIGNVRAWLATIVRNHCIDALRQGQRLPQPLQDMEWLGPRFLDQRSVRENSPETDIMGREVYHRLLSEMEALPARLRDVMMLRAYQDMPYKSIAIHLGISPENARKRVQQARELLRTRIHAQEKTDRVHPDPSHPSPRGERHAAETVLNTARPGPEIPKLYAQPIQVELNRGRRMELALYLPAKPLRIQQRYNTLRRYVQKHPGGWMKRKELADLLLLHGNIKGALSHYLLILEKQARNHAIRLRAAELLRLTGKTQKVDLLLSQGLDNCGDHGMSLYFMAMREALGTKPEQALPFWKAALKKDPGNVLHLRALARHLLYYGTAENAAILLRDLVHRFPMDREFHALYFESLRFSGSDSEIDNCVTTLKHKFPGDPYSLAAQAHWQLGKDMSGGGQREATFAMVKAVKSQVPGSVLALNLQVDWHFHQAAYDRCRKLIDEALEKSGKHLHFMQCAIHWLPRLKRSWKAKKIQKDLETSFPDRDAISSHLLL